MDELTTELRTSGFAILSGAALQRWLASPWQDWRGFSASWNDLGEDQHMADGGRYRRRRYAVFEVSKGNISRAPHQPHYQAKVYISPALASRLSNNPIGVSRAMRSDLGTDARWRKGEQPSKSTAIRLSHLTQEIPRAGASENGDFLATS
jgi:hypothetical protein